TRGERKPSKIETAGAAYPLLIESGMRMREGMQATIVAVALAALLCGCYGGREGSAAEEQVPKKNPIASDTTTTPEQQAEANPTTELNAISPAIPVYLDARYRDGLLRC